MKSTCYKLQKLMGVLLLAISPVIAQAELEELDRIIAIVNEDAILASELTDRLQIIKGQYGGPQQSLPPDDVLSAQVLDRLIVDSIQLQMGVQAGIRVGDEELTRAIMSIAERNDVTSLVAFQEQLAEKGIDYRSFREQMRQDLIIQEVQRYQMNRRIRITPKELENFLASPVSKNLIAEEYRLGHILIAASGRATTKAVQAAKEKAWGLYRQLQEGVLFKQIAIEHSDGGRALEGGDLGWRKAAQLPELFAGAVPEMSVGDILEPIFSPSGFHLVSLLEKRGSNADTEQQYKTRHILVRLSEIRSAEEAEVLIRDVYIKLLANASFSDMAKLHSDDPGSALTGGDLGWVSAATGLAPEFAEQMEAVPVGEISKPFQTEFGWHVLQVQERRNQDISQQKLEQQALYYLRSRRFEEEFESFLTEIRNDAYVELK